MINFNSKLTIGGMSFDSFEAMKEYARKNHPSWYIEASNKNVVVNGGSVFINGIRKDDYNHSEEGIHLGLFIEGSVESIETEYSPVMVKGNVNSVHTHNGTVECGDVTGNVETHNGTIKCGSVGGNAKTYNGNIYRK